jgi:hypothetical protein
MSNEYALAVKRDAKGTIATAVECCALGGTHER